MSEEQVWNTILSKLMKGTKEFPTTPKTNKKPVWFLAKTDGKNIFVDAAKHSQPPCKLTMERRLTYDEFKKIYPIYIKREKGENVSEEATNASRNQVYWFSLIKHLS